MIEWPLRKKLMYEQALGAHGRRQEAAQQAAQAQAQQGDAQSPQTGSGAGMGERTAPNARAAQQAAQRAQQQMGAADAFGGETNAAAQQTATPQRPRIQTGDREADQALNHPGVRHREHVYRVVPEEDLPTWEEMGYEDADEEFAEFDEHFAEKLGESFGGAEMPEDAEPTDTYLTEENRT